MEGWSEEALSLLAVEGGHPEERKDTDERKYNKCCQPLHPLSCFSLKFPSCYFVPCCVLEFFHTLSPRYLHAWHLKASNCQAVLHQGIPHGVVCTLSMGHLPNTFCFISPSSCFNPPSNLLHFPNKLLRFPNSLLHFPNRSLHFPNTVSHFPNTF